jgi:hypothetical protein
VFCPVRPHKAFHSFYQLPFIIRKFHINKVRHDNTSQIAEPELARNFFRRFQIGFEGILLLVVTYALITAVYVDNM